MATDFSNMVYDPATGTTKRKNQNLPYLNENEANQGYLPYTGGEQDYTPGALEQGNINVMGTAQTTALNQPQTTAMQDKTTEMTQKLMTDPNLGQDWQKYNTGMMSKFDADRASGLKEYKEANVGMGGAGQVQEGIVDLALSRNLDRGLFENELEQQAYEKGRQNYLEALGQGRTQGEYLDTAQQNYINNLLNVRGAYEGERAQTSNEALQRELTAANITSSEKIAGMDIASREKIAADSNYLTQQGIDLQSATLYGYDRPDGTHIYGQAELSGMKFGLESKDLDNQTVELFGGMVDTNGDGIKDKQIFGKYDLLSNEDKREADKLYGYDVKDAAGNTVGRIPGALELERDRVDIEKQGLEIDKAKIYGYDKADGTHVDGELDLAMKSQGIDLERLGIDKNTAYGYVQTDENGNPVIGADGKPVRVKGALELQTEEMTVRTLLAQLEERRVDTAEIESVYNFINGEIEAERASPDAAMDYLNGVLKKNGVELKEADKNAIFAEVAQDFKVQQYQFALANPDLGTFDALGNFIGLTEEGNRVFSNYVGSTLYGESTPVAGGEDLAEWGITSPDQLLGMRPEDLSLFLRNADDPNNQNNQMYQQAAAAAKTISPRIDSKARNTITLDANTGDVVNAGGRLMVITKGNLWSTTGRNHDEFEIMDIATGTKKLFTGLSSSDDSVNNFDSWVASLTTGA
jgi:hypothetical protein